MKEQWNISIKFDNMMISAIEYYCNDCDSQDRRSELENEENLQ